MPGLFGLITKMPRPQAEQKLSRMASALRHEDFYVAGTWCDESLGVYVGWTALKGAFAESMPLVNETKDVVLAFSGEEFPVPEIRRTLKERGHSIEPEGPSYLVHLYEDDLGFLEQLNGWFHGLVIDKRRGIATLFNDRYGMHRLYYHRSKDTFYFSAEAKAILAVSPETRSLDPDGMAEFITSGVALQGRTLFRDIYVLPGASAWVFRSGDLVEESRYFDPHEWEVQDELESEAYYLSIRDVFRRNLPRYFAGPQRVAMSLTGGLDSRMIMAWRPDPDTALPCYSFGGMYRDCRDVQVAREVANACGQSHQVIEVGNEFLSNFPYYAERTVFLTDGCSDVSHSPDFYAHQRAREIAPVRLTGNYGGEVLRRVWFFKPESSASHVFDASVHPYFHKAIETYGEGGGPLLSEVLFRQLPLHLYGQLALAQSQLTLRTPYLDNDLIRNVLRGPASSFADNNLCFRLLEEGSPYLGKIAFDREQGRKGVLAALKQRKLEFLFKAEYAFDTGMPQWLAGIDHALSRFHLERIFLGRHKWYHFRVWYRDALAPYIREILLDKQTLSRPYISSRDLQTKVTDHLMGRRNYTTEIHKVLSLELIHRLLIVPSAYTRFSSYE